MERAVEVLARLRAPGPPRLEVVHPDRVARPATVGLLPGSFDPPTVAHEALATALLGLGCGLVLLVWSVRTLPKERAPGGDPEPPLLADADRVACMTALARSRPGLGVALSSHGLLAEQAEGAAARFPGTRLITAMGSDKVLQLLDPRWYGDRDAALARLTVRSGLAYAARAGEEAAVAAVLAAPRNAGWADAFTRLAVDPAVAAVSSREVRRRLRAGDDVAALVPAAVRACLAAPGTGRGHFPREG